MRRNSGGSVRTSRRVARLCRMSGCRETWTAGMGGLRGHAECSRRGDGVKQGAPSIIPASPAARTPAPTLMRIGTLTIVGVGLIGGSIGLAARRRGLVGRVIGVGRQQPTLDQARNLSAIDEASLDLATAVRRADV